MPLQTDNPRVTKFRSSFRSPESVKALKDYDLKVRQILELIKENDGIPAIDLNDSFKAKLVSSDLVFIENRRFPGLTPSTPVIKTYLCLTAAGKHILEAV